jgi:CheY-like chemotaxis protein
MKKPVILCVDDDMMVLNSLEIQLKNHFRSSYLYEFAQSGEEALEIVCEMNEDCIEIIIIISDWLMPGMKGDEFLIKVHKKFPKIKSIMLTGEANEYAIEQARLNANLYAKIGKPWDGDTLINVIEDAIREYIKAEK